MQEIARKISKEEYDRLNAMTNGERNHEIEGTLSDAIIYGYGYYGHYLTIREGEHLLVLRIGNSCD